MGEVTQKVNIEMRKKLPDGNYRVEYPKTRSDSGVTFDEHLAEIASQDEYGHIKLDGLLKEGLNSEKLGGKLASDFLQGISAIFITGVYTGDGNSSKTINLGFKPSAVLVVSTSAPSAGIWYNDSAGFALTNYPEYSGESRGKGSIKLSINNNGFIVYGKLNNTNTYNDYSPYRYIAFK